MILRACTVCGALSDRGRCERHRSKDNRPSAARRGYDERWKCTRARFLRDHPTCDIPACHAPATEVHHRDGLGPLGPLGHDDSNLQALCQPHHAGITAQLQPGGWARRSPQPEPDHPSLKNGDLQ